jgi:integrase
MRRTVKDSIDEPEPPEYFVNLIEKEIPKYCKKKGFPWLIEKYQAFFAFLYLSGSRVTEALKIRKSNLILREGFVEVKNQVIVKRKEGSKTPKSRTYYIPLNHPLTKYFIQYQDKFKRDKRLFPHTRQWAYKLVKELTGKWPHWFRAMRVTHMLEFLKEQEIKVYMGWVRFVEDYAHPSKIAIGEKLSREYD